MSTLLARLNPKSVNYVATKGYSDTPITSADVAAALGVIDCPIQRECLCLIWAPEMATAQRGAEALAQAAVKEWDERTQKVQRTLHRANVAHAQGNTGSRVLLQERARREQKNCWPLPEVGATNYVGIARAAMHEWAQPSQCGHCKGSGYGKPAQCKDCHGTGKTKTGICTTCGGSGQDSKPQCKHCNGTGNKPYTLRQRAKASGFDHHSTFKRAWVPLYDWCLSQASKHYGIGVKRFEEQLK